MFFIPDCFVQMVPYEVMTRLCDQMDSAIEEVGYPLLRVHYIFLLFNSAFCFEKMYCLTTRFSVVSFHLITIKSYIDVSRYNAYDVYLQVEF